MEKIEMKKIHLIVVISLFIIVNIGHGSNDRKQSNLSGFENLSGFVSGMIELSFLILNHEQYRNYSIVMEPRLSSHKSGCAKGLSIPLSTRNK